MIDLTRKEKDSIEYALKPLGEYVAEIGMSRPLADYSREEVLCLIEVAVTAYQEFMQQKEADSEEDLPCQILTPVNPLGQNYQRKYQP